MIQTWFTIAFISVFLNRQTLSVKETQNKNVDLWMHSLIDDAPFSDNGTWVFRQSGHSLQDMRNTPGWWGSGTRSSDVTAFYNRRRNVMLVPKNVTANKKGRYSEPHSHTFLNFCNLFHTKLLDLLSRHANNDHCQNKVQEYMVF